MNIVTGVTVLTIDDKSKSFFCIIKLNNTQFISGGNDCIKIYDTETGITIKELNKFNLNANITCLLKLSSDIVIVANYLGQLFYLSLITQQKSMLEGHLDYVSCLIKFNDNKFVSGSWDKTIKIWDSQNCNRNHNISICLMTITCGHIFKIDKINKNEIVVASSNRQLEIFNIYTGNKIKMFDFNQLFFTYVLKLNKYQIISGNSDNIVQIWDLF